MSLQRNGTHAYQPFKSVIAYGVMIALTAAAFLLIRGLGEGVLASTRVPPGTFAAAIPATNVFVRLLIAIAAIIATGQLLNRLFARFGQPPVIGEVVAGILLGPSLLGTEISAVILPASVAPALGVIAQLGVVLYMFLVGLELNPALLKHRTRAMIATSHAGILLPFLLASFLAIYLYPRLSYRDVSFTTFALFLGVAMSITAFPVLARILDDYRLTRTTLGTLALGCAAIDDVTAWCLLAVVTGVAQAQPGHGLLVAAAAAAFLVLMFVAGRPLLQWIVRRWDKEQPSQTIISLTFLALLLSAITAEAIGIHAIFGAFVLGTIIPHDSVAAKALRHQLENVVGVLLLPAFFAFTGMRTRIDLLAEPSDWLICGLITAVAIAGKVGGTVIASRLTGLGWRSAAMLGALMNTRGLMELIVLNVGLDLGVISPRLFSMMVIMALVTTALTAPMLRLLGATDETRSKALFQVT